MARAAAPRAATGAWREAGSEESPSGLKAFRRTRRRKASPDAPPDPRMLPGDLRCEGSGGATGAHGPAETTALFVTGFAAVGLDDGRQRPVGQLADAAAIPAGLRRRLRGPTLAAVCAGLGALGGTTKPVELVFCSRHGDLPRTQNLLVAMAKRRPLSPLEFPLSVHNAVAGLLDLVRGERTGHTSIAAGRDSFAAALIELWARLRAHPDRAMLLVYVEHEMPEELRSQVDRGPGGIILAALIETPAAAGRPLAVLRREPRARATARDGEAEARSMLSVLEGGGPVRLASRIGFDWLVEPAR